MVGEALQCSKLHNDVALRNLRYARGVAHQIRRHLHIFLQRKE